MGYVFDKSGKLKRVSEEEWEAADNEGCYIVIFDRGATADGKAYWLYIAVRPSKYREFLYLTVRREKLRYQNFGTILRYGFNKQAPANIRQEMKEKYGNDDNYKRWLEQDVEQIKLEFRKEKDTQEQKRISDIVTMLKEKQPK